MPRKIPSKPVLALYVILAALLSLAPVLASRMLGHGAMRDIRGGWCQCPCEKQQCDCSCQCGGAGCPNPGGCCNCGGTVGCSCAGTGCSCGARCENAGNPCGGAPACNCGGTGCNTQVCAPKCGGGQACGGSESCSCGGTGCSCTKCKNAGNPCGGAPACSCQGDGCNAQLCPPICGGGQPCSSPGPPKVNCSCGGGDSCACPQRCSRAQNQCGGTELCKCLTNEETCQCGAGCPEKLSGTTYCVCTEADCHAREGKCACTNCSGPNQGTINCGCSQDSCKKNRCLQRCSGNYCKGGNPPCSGTPNVTEDGCIRDFSVCPIRASFEDDHPLREISGSAVVDIVDPVWKLNLLNKPACYTRNTKVNMKLRLGLTPTLPSGTSISLRADGPGTNLDFEKTGIGISGHAPEASGILSSENLENKVYIENLKTPTDSALLWQSKKAWGDWGGAGSTGPHKIFVTLSAPAPPQAQPWVEVLDSACVWCSGADTPLGVMTSSTEQAYSKIGKNYNGGHTHTDGSTFHLREFLTVATDSDCRDMSAVVQVFSNALGIRGSCAKRVNGQFYTKEIDPVGNPSWQTTLWNFHQMGWYGGKVFDACLRLKNPERVPVNEELDTEYKDDLFDSGYWDPEVGTRTFTTCD